MPKFNDLDLKEWKQSDILTDSLWLIPERDNSGKHDGSYHGNFIPQIPRQLIQRYTKKHDTVFDPFLGSGTTAYEAENLDRCFIGIDIQNKLIKDIEKKIDPETKHCKLITGDSTQVSTFKLVDDTLADYPKDKVQLTILHPPYANIIKFSQLKNDLSNASSLSNFLDRFTQVVQNTIDILEDKGYLAIVIGDMYTKGEWVPLGFYCMQATQKLGLKLKSIIIKNMAGNRAKRKQEGIWRYRALSSDYYIFKHEYILIFKK